jgi:cell wall-associated NlpC family hydrolase
MSWATDQIGKPWRADGEGPHAYSCWGLVRAAFRAVHGVDIPHVAVASPEESQVRSIMHAARVSSWRPVEGVRADGDIVLMRDRRKVHCGLVIAANGYLGVLHSSHTSGVVYQRWEDAVSSMTHELWRKHAS